jgi:hypothetical protein
MATWLRQFLRWLVFWRRYVVDKEKNEVFWETRDEGRGRVRTLVAGADAATFEVLNLPGPIKDFARDKNRVYLAGMVVSGAHPESFTFRKLNVRGGLRVPGGGNYYYRDSERVFIYPKHPEPLGRWYCGFIKMLADSDPESFRVMGGGWSRDRNRVYLFEKGFTPRDIDSFERLERLWARDSKAYYWGTREVLGADRNTFHISEKRPCFASDCNHLFWHGWLIEGCDPHTFHITSGTAGYDNRFAYEFQEVWEANVDADYRKINVHKQPLK